MTKDATKTVLFTGMNLPGHINPLLGLADRLKRDHSFRTIFVLFGPPSSNTIEEHGHQLITLEESFVFEDYEVLEEEIESGLMLGDDEKKRRGLTKRAFLGAAKLPQIILRYQNLCYRPSWQKLIQVDRLIDELGLREARANHAQYERIIAELEPDLIVLDNYFPIPAIMKLKQTPWVKLDSCNPLMLVHAKKGLKHAPPPSRLGCKLLDKASRARLRKDKPFKWRAMVEYWNELDLRLAEAAQSSDVSRRFREFLVEAGCSSDASSESPYLNLYLYPKELDYDQEDDLFEYGARQFRCDSLVRLPKVKPAATGEVWSLKITHALANLRCKCVSACDCNKSEPQLVYFSMGTVASSNWRLMSRLISILSGDKRRRLYVVSKGINGDRFELDKRNMIGANYLPQTFFLERAHLAIIHGGNNSLVECLQAGVPMIVLPIEHDQPDNAQRIEDLNLGKRLDAHDCSETELLGAVDELLADHVLKQRLSSIASSMRKRDDASKVAAMLNKLAHDGHLEQAFIEQCRAKSFNELNLKPVNV